MFKIAPDYANLRVFGSLCFAYNNSLKRDKFDSRTKRCLFLGYHAGHKAFKLYDLDTHNIFISRDVIFFENILPYKISHHAIHPQPSPSQMIQFAYDNSNAERILPSSTQSLLDETISESSQYNPSFLPTPNSSPISSSSHTSIHTHITENDRQQATISSVVHDVPSPVPLRTSSRIITPSHAFQVIGGYIPHKNVSTAENTQSLSFTVNSSNLEPKHSTKLKMILIRF